VGFTKPLGAQPEAKTPFMDGLVANEGRLLTHHYVYRLCAPTRAMLMVRGSRCCVRARRAEPLPRRTRAQTGRYPGHGIWQQLPGFTSEQGLNLSLPLFPAVLKAAGYSTHQVGKCECAVSSSRQLRFLPRYMLTPLSASVQGIWASTDPNICPPPEALTRPSATSQVCQPPPSPPLSPA
jgi:hypothetical protein